MAGIPDQVDAMSEEPLEIVEEFIELHDDHHIEPEEVVETVKSAKKSAVKSVTKRTPKARTPKTPKEVKTIDEV